MENMEQGTAAGNQQEEQKLFTQEELTKIVQSRLARAKLDAESSADFRKREDDLNRRELALDAREALADAGLPKELVSAINCTDRETMLKSIKTLQAVYGSAGSSSDARHTGQDAHRYRISTGVSNTTNGGGHRKNDDADIRKAMGLKGS